ncbi:DUF2059 domain-containing protein [Brevundimonas sp.]|uniref:DUF2059 domain-containing protein n=1 Tax=Brevundimonas sp. TaxID=1871086 RepID=UPI0025FDDEE5|nr:DUF2059 domain-containing protein [Brevundimonas sp.]
MRAFLIILAAVTGLATPALAQEAPETSDREWELARQYVEMMDLQGMMQDQIVGSAEMADDWASALAPTGPGAPKPDDSADMPIFLPDGTMDSVSPMIELMEEVMVEAHVQVFTEAELEALVTFYEGDVGRGILDKQSELSLVMTTLMMERLPELLGAALGDLSGEGEESFDLDAWTDPTPPLVRQMSPAY